MKHRTHLFLAFLLSSCTLSPTSTRGATLVLKPQIKYVSTQGELLPYTKGNIDHLTLQLFTLDAGEISTGITRTVANAQLDNVIVLSNLKSQTTYRVRAYAYTTDNQLINSADTNSYIDIILNTDDQPTVGTLNIRLDDRTFAAQGTSSIAVIPGTHVYAGALDASQPGFQGIVETFVGNIATETIDATGTAASVRYPFSLTCDATGNIYVMSTYQIRKITPAGVVTTLAGNGTLGYANGDGVAAQFKNSYGLVADRAGNLYVNDSTGFRIRKVTPTGTVTTIAGSGVSGTTDGYGAAAKFNTAYGATLDPEEQHLYVCDWNGGRIRKIHLDDSNYVETIAGNGTLSSIDGIGSGATFNRPQGVVIGPDGMLYIAEGTGRRIRKMNLQTREVTTFAGNGLYTPYLSGIGTSAMLYNPRGITCDQYGYLYVADASGHRIRKISPTGNVTTLAGTGINGLIDGAAQSAQFYTPYGVAVDASGTVYVADYNNHRIRKIY